MRNVLVTGGSRGIGLAIATRLAAASDFNVIAAARAQGEPLTAAMAGAPGRLHFVRLDLADVDAIPEFVRELKSQFGPLYGLVNNAGLGTDGLLANMHVSQIEQVVRVNTLAPMVLSKYVVRGMMTEGAGRVINMSSITGSNGYNGLAVYAATKASMIGFSRSLAREVGKLGITVNAIAPGFIDTDLTANLGDEGRETIVRRSALRRLAEVEDVAAMVEFLLGDGGRNITGAVMTIDAGNTA